MSIPLKRLDKYIWEIPQSYKKGMRVPARIFADDVLIEKMKNDLTLVQAANVAHLPGIYKYSIVLPDGHQGYGFPIGGVAALDANEGVISPGGVGYDINCLPPGTKVLTPLGYKINIEDLAKGGEVTVIDKSKGLPKKTSVMLFLYRNEKILYSVKTKSGYTLELSEDHPVLVKNIGMVKAGELREGMEIALYPFEGVEYEKPIKFTIIREEEFSPGIRNELKKRDLLPLTSTNAKLPYLLKILGYALGDGTINGKNLQLYGRKEDLEQIKNDLEKIGYKASIYSRLRMFKHKEYQLKVSAKSLTELLYKMGYPRGKKSEAKYRIPLYVYKLPLWMKRLFIAAYFGAELSKPKTFNGYNFYMPELKIVKLKNLSENGKSFLKDLQKILREFGVKSVIKKAYEENGKICWRLLIKSDPANLIKLYSRIGYEYNSKRRKLALAAIVYLKLKLKITKERRVLRKLIKEQYKKGIPVAILAEVYNNRVNQRFVERSVYENVEYARIPEDSLTFEEFLEKNVNGEIVYDEIDEIKIKKYNGKVYDITVNDENHNFIANNFIVSNCGVRVLRTNLMYDDVRPVLKKLIDTLFRYIPSGLGSTGKLRLSISELEKVLAEGADWAIDHGYGWPEDREHIEENGHMTTADPDRVSHRAKTRGRNQLGTLGSGNHFLEIQVVDKIFNKEAAKLMGIYEEGQVMVMIHTGSRGLGHQVCSDYLKQMEIAARRYRVPLPDRELVSVPVTSREAEEYFAAMSAAANFAWANRQIIMHWTRQAFEHVLRKSADDLDMHLIYDVAHNIAKLEEHKVDGKKVKVYVHRKGATRAFPAGHPAIPKDYRSIGQPVIIPGSMGTASYILIGQPTAMDITFGSTAHGAGRLRSRAEAVRTFRASRIIRDLEAKGIIVRADSMRVVAEEAPSAYKDVDRVAKVSHDVGIATLVVRLKPIGVTKG